MIAAVTSTLQTYLSNAIPQLRPNRIQPVSLHKDDGSTLPDKAVVLGLYGVEEHAYMRNRPLVRDHEGYRQPPVMLALKYIITDLSNDVLESQKRLSAVLRVFMTAPRLSAEHLHHDLVGHVESLAVRLTNPTMEQMNQLWTAWNRGMRLALYYEVTMAPIVLEQPELVPPVRRLDVGTPV